MYVVFQAAKRMVQTMSQGLYSMGTVVQGEKLGQFLENDFPSMDNLKVRGAQILVCSYDRVVEARHKIGTTPHAL